MKSIIQENENKENTFTMRDFFIATQNLKKKDFTSFEISSITTVQKEKVKIVELILVIMGTISVLLSTWSYNLEFEDNKLNDLTCIVLLWIVSILTFITLILVAFKNHLNRKLKILRKEAPKHYGLLKIFGWKRIILENIFIIIHPSPFLFNIKIWIYSME